jgi:hypothetical protein
LQSNDKMDAPVKDGIHQSLDGLWRP